MKKQELKEIFKILKDLQVKDLKVIKSFIQGYNQ